MATVAYEDVLRDAQQLTPEEQQRLQSALRKPMGARVVAPRELKALLASGLAERKSLNEEERLATAEALKGLKQLARRVSTAWKDQMSAVEAVQDVRREL